MKIDIKAIIEQKSKRRFPNWLIRPLERLIHQDEINSFLARHSEKEAKDFLKAFLDEQHITLEWQNAEQLPKDSRYLFVSNHPLGGIDGIAIAYMLHEHYGDVRYLVNDMLYHIEPLQSIFLPVNTYGAQNKDRVKLLKEAFESDVPIGSFPAGYCSRYLEGKIQDCPWQKSFIRLVIEHKRAIVPLHFVGQNSKHFYLIDRVRKFLGIKFDIGTALLPDEMYRAKGKKFSIIVGEPIPWQSLAESKQKANSLAQEIKAKSYALVKEDKHIKE